MELLRKKKGFICDMDGVIYKGDRLLPGVKEFVDWLYQEDKKFLFLTNNSGKSQSELPKRLYRMGLEVDEKHFYTSALATANFLSRQNPGCSAYVIGDRMDTDVIAGIESGLVPILVLTGVTTRESMAQYPYRPRLVLNGVIDIPNDQALSEKSNRRWNDCLIGESKRTNEKQQG